MSKSNSDDDSCQLVTSGSEDDAEHWKQFEERAKKRGVVYLSRIPPFMNPQKLRRILEQFGEIGRIYLTPEDAAVARRRKKYKSWMDSILAFLLY